MAWNQTGNYLNNKILAISCFTPVEHWWVSEIYTYIYLTGFGRKIISVWCIPYETKQHLFYVLIHIFYIKCTVTHILKLVKVHVEVKIISIYIYCNIIDQLSSSWSGMTFNMLDYWYNLSINNKARSNMTMEFSNPWKHHSSNTQQSLSNSINIILNQFFRILYAMFIETMYILEIYLLAYMYYINLQHLIA